MTTQNLSSKPRLGVAAAVILASVACSPSNGAAAADQAPKVPPAPSAPPAGQVASTAPAPKPSCTDGIFRPAANQDLAGSPDAATLRQRAVTFDDGQLKAMPASLALNLFDDLCVTARRQPGEAAPVPVWTGTIDGVAGSQVTFIFNPGAVAANIVMPPRAYQLELVRDGLYRLREVDPSKYANELPALTPPPPLPPPQKKP
jgi:hypothetical protein